MFWLGVLVGIALVVVFVLALVFAGGNSVFDDYADREEND